MRRPLRLFVLWLLIGLSVVGLVVQQSLSADPIPSPSFGHGDKVGHLAVYFLLMFWFVQLFERRAHLLLGGLFISLGVGLELLQGMSGYRFFEYADMAANTLGVVFAYMAAPRFGDVLLRCERRYSV